MGTKQAVRFNSLSVGVVFDLHLAQRQLSLQSQFKRFSSPHWETNRRTKKPNNEDYAGNHGT